MKFGIAIKIIIYAYLGITSGSFTRHWQSGWVGKLDLKLISGKDLINKHKKAPPFFGICFVLLFHRATQQKF